MRVLITGITGFVGKELGARLVKEGHEVVALARDEEAARRALLFPAELHSWNPAEPLRDIDAVVHLAGENIAGQRWTKARKKALLDSRVKTAAAVRKLAEGARGRRPNVFLSASGIGFYGDRGDEWLTEEAGVGEGFLAEICVAWERAVLAPTPPWRTVVFRIGMVLGAGGALAKMLPVFRAGLGGPIGDGRQWMSWIELDDLVGAFVHALGDGNMNGIYNAVAPHPVSNREFTRTLARVVRRPAWLPAPKFALKMGLGEMSTLLLASQRVSSARLEGAGFRFAHPGLEQAIARALGKT